jgi:LTXXQ motif family protein
MSKKSNKIVVALLASVAVTMSGVSSNIMAAPHPGGAHGAPGGHASFGGGGFHVGGFGGFRGFAGHGSAVHTFARPSFAQPSSGGRLPASAPARSRIAAAPLHGLYDFSRAGFNRNAFGDGRGWDRWGSRLRGAGWNRRGWGGWAGPVFWPFLYGDVLSFAFWPYGDDDPFWAYGPDFLVDSAFAGGSAAPNLGYAVPAEGSSGAAGEVAQSCGGVAPGVNDLPIEQIKQRVRPTADQQAALDDLNAASEKAKEIVKASCPSETPLTPVARLDAVQKRLEAMMQAVRTLRSPLAKFYDVLSDQQKQQFEAVGTSRRAQPGRTPVAAGGVALCGPEAGDFTKVPMQRMEETVEPNAQQNRALETLKEVSDKAINELRASCPTQIGADPAARLATTEERLGAMVDALKTIRPKLEDFYTSLSDEQKARLNTMQPPKKASVQTQQQRYSR